MKKEEPIKCLVWGTGQAFSSYYHTIKYFEMVGQINVCGVTSNESVYNAFVGYRHIKKKDIKKEDYEVVILMALTKQLEIEMREEVLDIGIAEYQIVPCRVIGLFEFDFYKYLELKKNPPSIFTRSCWGGLTYHRLGLRMDSPFINMWESDEDFLKLLERPKHYMSCELRFGGMEYDVEGIYRPVAICDDILLHFNHYNTFEEAKEAWERRKRRINRDNIFVMFVCYKHELVEKFCALPYEKKVCFVPWHTEQKNVVSIDWVCREEVWSMISDLASGRRFYYDALELLLHGNVVPWVSYQSKN